MYWSQKVGRGDYFLQRSAEITGGRSNPFSPIGANAFRTTNFRSRFAMRGAEIHGNTCRDSTTRIPGIVTADARCSSYQGITSTLPSHSCEGLIANIHYESVHIAHSLEQYFISLHFHNMCIEETYTNTFR